MKGYKGFNPDMTCRGKQYAENTTYEEPTAELCKSGMHFCKEPFAVFNYYPPTDNYGRLNEFAEVEADDADVITQEDKSVCKKLKIGAKIGLPGLISAQVEYIKSNIEKTESNTGECSVATNTWNRSAATNTGNRSAATNTGDWSAATNTGDWSAATNTGDWSAATNTGNRSAATNTGDWSAATVEGKDSFAIATGIEGKAAGALGCYIAVAEWKYDNTLQQYVLVGFKSHKVDGKTIKPGVYYTLKNGKFVEFKEDAE